MNFEEQILEAAKSIAAATSALVKAASAAQRELVAQGKVRQEESAPPKSAESHAAASATHTTLVSFGTVGSSNVLQTSSIFNSAHLAFRSLLHS